MQAPDPQDRWLHIFGGARPTPRERHCGVNLRAADGPGESWGSRRGQTRGPHGRADDWERGAQRRGWHWRRRSRRGERWARGRRRRDPLGEGVGGGAVWASGIPPAVAHPVPASLPRLRLRLRLRALLLSGRGRRRRRRRRGIQPGPPPPPPGRDPTMHLFPHPHRPTLPRGMPRREEGRASRPRHDAGAGWGGGGAREGAEREAAGVGGMTTRGGAARARGSCGRQRGSGAPLGPARP